jgi:hypothetical protein
MEKKNRHVTTHLVEHEPLSPILDPSVVSATNAFELKRLSLEPQKINHNRDHRETMSAHSLTTRHNRKNDSINREMPPASDCSPHRWDWLIESLSRKQPIVNSSRRASNHLKTSSQTHLCKVLRLRSTSIGRSKFYKWIRMSKFPPLHCWSCEQVTNQHTPRERERLRTVEDVPVQNKGFIRR